MAQLKQYGFDNISSDDIIYGGTSLTEILDKLLRIKITTYNLGSPTASNILAILYEDGELNISGTGNMLQFSSNMSLPWHIDSNYNKIKKVSLNDPSLKPTSLDYLLARCMMLNDLSDFNVPSTVTSMSHTLEYIPFLTSLPSTFIIPDSVTDVSHLFNNCASLSNINNLVIPNNVTNITGLFYSCGSLNGTVTIRGKATSYINCFLSCSTNPSSKLIVNYTSANASIIDTIIATKSSNSNILKGIQVS